MVIPVDVYNHCLELAERSVANQTTPSERDVPLGATYELVDAIWRHAYQRHIRATAHVHRRTGAVESYLHAFRRGSRILAIARRRDVNFSPYLLARIILEHELGVRRDAVGALVRHPEGISDARLRAELADCIASDEHNGPRFDRLRAAAGKVHEALLELGLQV